MKHCIRRIFAAALALAVAMSFALAEGGAPENGRAMAAVKRGAREVKRAVDALAKQAEQPEQPEPQQLEGAAADDSEESLRSLLSGESGWEDFDYFYRFDYDGDGSSEAFALAGAFEDKAYAGDLWFVSANGAQPLLQGRAYAALEIDGSAPGMIFRAVESESGTAHTWTVENGAPREVTGEEAPEDGGEPTPAEAEEPAPAEEPAEAAEPALPEEAAEPEGSVLQQGPAGAAEPALPEEVAEPEGSILQEGPTGAAEPALPEEPAEPEGSVLQQGPSGAAEPALPEEVAEPEGSVLQQGPAGAAEPVEPEEPAEPEGSVLQQGPAGAAEPGSDAAPASGWELEPSEGLPSEAGAQAGSDGVASDPSFEGGAAAPDEGLSLDGYGTPTPRYGEADNGAQYARVTEEAELHTGPGDSFGNLGPLPAGASLEYLNEQAQDAQGEAWCYVRYGDSTGWCPLRSVQMEGAAAPQASAESAGTVRAYVTYDSPLCIAPDPRAAAITWIPGGEAVEYLGESARDENGMTWYYISYMNWQGWSTSVSIGGN